MRQGLCVRCEVKRSRLPLILIVISVVMCLLLTCIAAAGSVTLRRVLDVARRTTEAAPASDAGVTSTAIPAVNRVLVVGDDGNIYTVRPDGGDRINLTTDADEQHVYRQPAWSPDGQRIAWVASVAGAPASQTSLLTGLVDGRDVTRTDMGGFAPFYLFWSPDGGRVACLSSWAEGLALRTVAVADHAAEPVLIGSGQPFYFAWSPDGQQLLAHLSGERLSFLSLRGAEERLDARPGVFGAPQWSADGDHLVFVARQGAEQQLTWAAVDGSIEKELATIEGFATFALSPAGAQIALVDTTFEVGTAAFGPLSVINIETGEQVLISEAPALAFFWSPSGDRLAYLTPADPPEDGPRASLAASHLDLWLQWRIWDGAASYELARFAPADIFLADHLRFFDQYARSMTPWSPDGAALTFAGQTEDGALGVWVQAVQGDRRLDRVGDGVYAAWSPR